MRRARGMLLTCLLLGLMALASGCATSEQQRYREHLGMSIQPSANSFGNLFATVDPDNP